MRLSRYLTGCSKHVAIQLFIQQFFCGFRLSHCLLSQFQQFHTKVFSVFFCTTYSTVSWPRSSFCQSRLVGTVGKSKLFWLPKANNVVKRVNKGLWAWTLVWMSVRSHTTNCRCTTEVNLMPVLCTVCMYALYFTSLVLGFFYLSMLFNQVQQKKEVKVTIIFSALHECTYRRVLSCPRLYLSWCMVQA